jgi:hypothetical protein
VYRYCRFYGWEPLVVAEIDPEPQRRRRGWDVGRNPAVLERFLQYVEGLMPLDV